MESLRKSQIKGGEPDRFRVAERRGERRGEETRKARWRGREAATAQMFTMPLHVWHVWMCLGAVHKCQGLQGVLHKQDKNMLHSHNYAHTNTLIHTYFVPPSAQMTFLYAIHLDKLQCVSVMNI